MAKSTVRQEKPFGADHGLIHEVVVTGRSVGADETFWSKLAHNASLFAEVVAMVNGGGIKAGSTTSLAQAKVIMGDNYHDPVEWAKACGFHLTNAYKAAFANVPYSCELLVALKGTHLLVPILKLSIMQLHARFNGLFYDKGSSWYAEQDFATHQSQGGWLLVRRDVLPGSTSKRFAEQEAMLQQGEYTPEARELVQAIICHAYLTDERLLPTIWARTSSVASSGLRVNVGLFDGQGLGIDRWGDHADSDFGVTGARKLN